MKYISHFCMVLALLATFALTACSDDEGVRLGAEPTITVSGFSPDSGLPGTVVTVTGNNFGSNARVFFHESEATEYLSRTDTEIQVKVPANAANGRLCVINGDDYGFSAASFTFVASATITALSSDYGRSGDHLTLTGRNFHQLADGQLKVLFGSVQAEIVSVLQNSIEVIVPDGLEDGYVAINVVFGDIQTVMAPQFRIGDKIADPFTKTFNHHDIVSLTGVVNPCSYAALDYTSLICERDKDDKTEYVVNYSTAYDENTPVLSFALWDAKAGNDIIFKFDVPETSDFYVYFGSRGNAAARMQVAVSSDLSNFGEGIEQLCTPLSNNWTDRRHEFNVGHLKAGRYYLKITFVDALVINDISLTNVQKTEE